MSKYGPDSICPWVSFWNSSKTIPHLAWHCILKTAAPTMSMLISSFRAINGVQNYPTKRCRWLMALAGGYVHWRSSFGKACLKGHLTTMSIRGNLHSCWTFGFLLQFWLSMLGIHICPKLSAPSMPFSEVRMGIANISKPCFTYTLSHHLNTHH